MDEWQPAVIAPYDPNHPGIECPDQWKSISGKKVRIKPVPTKEKYGCGGQRILFHPDDALLIGCPEDCKYAAFACEHFILTD